MQVAKDFKLQEFVPEEIYSRFGDSSIWFVDKKLFKIAQLVKNRFNVVTTINNWCFGGTYNLSGFRPPSSNLGASLSQHKFGRAIDVKQKGITPEELIEDIIKNYNRYKAVGVTTIENIKDTPTWVHIDCRLTMKKDLLIVNR